MIGVGLLSAFESPLPWDALFMPMMEYAGAIVNSGVKDFLSNDREVVW